jgi:hypothetical protein
MAGTSTCRSTWPIRRGRAAVAVIAGQQLENNFDGLERSDGLGVEYSTPDGVPPSPQPLTHSAKDPGPFGRRGLLFLWVVQNVQKSPRGLEKSSKGVEPNAGSAVR